MTLRGDASREWGREAEGGSSREGKGRALQRDAATRTSKEGVEAEGNDYIDYVHIFSTYERTGSRACTGCCTRTVSLCAGALYFHARDTDTPYIGASCCICARVVSTGDGSVTV